MKKFALAALALFAMFAVAAPSQAGERLTLRLAHDLEHQHIVAQTFRIMAEEIERESGGSMRLRIYENGQMGGARETMELLQNGGLDMTKGSGNLETFAPIYSVFSLPYVFSGKEHHDKVVYGPIGREIFESTKDKGFFTLAAYDCGTRSYFAKKPITAPKELTGLKIRVQPSPMSLQMVELMGGLPTPVPFQEVYTALQQGVVDGAENNIPTWVHTRNIEVAKVYTENEHTSVPDFLVVSTQTWDKLTDKQREILEKAARNSETLQRDMWAKEMRAAREKATELGGTIVQVDKAPFRQAVQPMWDEYLKDPANKTLVEKIQAADK